MATGGIAKKIARQLNRAEERPAERAEQPRGGGEEEEKPGEWLTRAHEGLLMRTSSRVARRALLLLIAAKWKSTKTAFGPGRQEG